MAANTYDAFCGRMIRQYEGGYGWNRADPGGPTKYGITCFDYAAYRGQKMDSMERWAPLVKAMTLAEADAIYARKYATVVRYNDLPAGVDACIFDYGVNSGTSRPILVAHRILSVSGTGMTTALLDALKKVDPVWFISQMCAERLTFMHSIRGGSAWAEFGKGWGARVADLKAYCTHLATSASPAMQTTPMPVAPDLSMVATPKAIHEAKTAGTKTVVSAGTVGVAAEAAGVAHHWVAVLVIATFLVGIAYEAYQDLKVKKANDTVVIPAALPAAA